MGTEIVMKDEQTSVFKEQGQAIKTPDISFSRRDHICSDSVDEKKRVTGNAEVPAVRKFTQEQLQNEFNYMQAEKITRMLLEKGLISGDEFDKIMDENKKTFPTFLSPLL